MGTRKPPLGHEVADHCGADGEPCEYAPLVERVRHDGDEVYGNESAVPEHADERADEHDVERGKDVRVPAPVGTRPERLTREELVERERSDEQRGHRHERGSEDSRRRGDEEGKADGKDRHASAAGTEAEGDEILLLLLVLEPCRCGGGARCARGFCSWGGRRHRLGDPCAIRGRNGARGGPERRRHGV